MALENIGETEEKPDDGQDKSDGDDGQEKKKNQEKQPNKDRYVWSDYRHAMFLKVCQELNEEGRDIVPKNIIEKMTMLGEKIKREQVASHLQKYRENLAKQKKQKLHRRSASANTMREEEDIGWKGKLHQAAQQSHLRQLGQQPHLADAAAGAPEGPSPSLHPLPQAHLPSLPPAAAADADAPAPDVPQQQPQMGQHAQLPGTPLPGTPPFCLNSNGDAKAATALLHQQLELEAIAVPTAEQVQQRSALLPLQSDAAGRRMRLIMQEQPARLQQNQVYAAASGLRTPMLMNRYDRLSVQLAMTRAHHLAAAGGAHGHRTLPEPHVQACPPEVATIRGGTVTECSAAVEANMRYEDAEIRNAQQLRNTAAAMAGEGQERAAGPEPDDAVAGSPSTPESVVARFWKSDEPSWDFLGMPQTRNL